MNMLLELENAIEGTIRWLDARRKMIIAFVTSFAALMLALSGSDPDTAALTAQAEAQTDRAIEIGGTLLSLLGAIITAVGVERIPNGKQRL